MIQDSNESHSAGKRESSKVRELNTDEGNLYVEIGLRLRRIRREKDYTQEQMAEMLGISTAYYGKIERGVNSLSIKRLHTLNVKLGIDITYLITGKDNNTLSMGQILAECPIRLVSKKFTLLDLVTILGLGMGVEGPALATVLSQGVSGLICLVMCQSQQMVLV